MNERLQKIIARSGLVSRRKAEALIREGKVSVNGQRVTELGAVADPAKDRIALGGHLLRAEPLVYFAVNKPRGVLSAVSDPKSRPVVTGLVRTPYRIYPAGRLDFASEGLLILTNDGELTRILTSAGTVDKVYWVKAGGMPSAKQLERLRRGVRIESERLAPCKISQIKEGNNPWFEVVLRQGRNRQIRKMFEAINHPVMRLRRVAIGPVQLGNLRPGESRTLSPVEVELLRQAGGGSPVGRTGTGTAFAGRRTPRNREPRRLRPRKGA